VLDAATSSDIYIDSICGGRGKCGKCKVLIDGSVKSDETDLLTAEEKARGYYLSCLARVAGNLRVTVPKESRVESHQILMRSLIEPLSVIDQPVVKVPLSLTPPSLVDYLSDLERVTHALRNLGIERVTMGLPTLKKLSRTLRENHWNVNVTLMDLWGREEIIDIGSTSDNDLIGIAVDIGTTTIVVELVDLITGAVIDARSDYNKQVVYGRTSSRESCTPRSTKMASANSRAPFDTPSMTWYASSSSKIICGMKRFVALSSLVIPS